jgi:glutamate synthase domain-containing protein 2
MRFVPYLIIVALLATSVAGLAESGWQGWLWAPLVILGGLTLIGLFDLIQTKHTIWRNFPVIGRVRWMAEELRPFLRSYIVESETEGRPFNHENRALIYRRAKNVPSVEPFGSHLDNHKPPHEYLAHSIAAKHPETYDFRVTIGEGRCAQPYSASVYNISAMSFGSLGARAIEALNRGAARGGFYHDTGEGGVSRFHRAGGGDLVWELGSGYFGCRTPEGRIDPEKFEATAKLDQVKMIEIKLSQGAKPGHGGVLPGSKVTREIADARGIAVGETCISPPFHPEFSTPLELMAFIGRLRELSGGKPVGVKLCIGRRHEFLAIVKAMLETGERADFIVVDGAEGGTGAAPAEFLDHIGAPLREGLAFVRNALVGAGLKDEVRIGASGKQITAYQIATTLALGADFVNSARGFMFALGCIQSLQCHTNRCPTGVATTDPGRQRGLVIPEKATRVFHFHENTLKALAEVIGAAGVDHPSQLSPDMVYKFVAEGPARRARELRVMLGPGDLLTRPGDTPLGADWAKAQADSFASAGPAMHFD